MSEDNFGPWIDWAGGPCPIPDAKAGDFEIKLRNGKTIGWGSAEYWATWQDWWQWQGPKPKAIVAYRVRRSVKTCYDRQGWIPHSNLR